LYDRNEIENDMPQVTRVFASLASLFVASIACLEPPPSTAQDAKMPPADWIDPATGHRVIRLSDERGGTSLYFHQNTYTPEGDKLIFNTKGGIAVVDVTKLSAGPPKVEVVVKGGSAVAMARKTREVYFTKGGKGGGTYAANVDTQAVRQVPNARGTTI